MSYTGYCIVHDLCSVFVFASEYRDRKSVYAAMPRTIGETFGYPGASYDAEVFTAESERGQNVWEIAQNAARDAVGQFAYGDKIGEYALLPDLIDIAPLERATARRKAREYNAPADMVQALADALCAVHLAGDESEIAPELSALLESMTEYYN